jgi:hypothetical protein
MNHTSFNNDDATEVMVESVTHAVFVIHPLMPAPRESRELGLTSALRKRSLLISVEIRTERHHERYCRF